MQLPLIIAQSGSLSFVPALTGQLAVHIDCPLVQKGEKQREREGESERGREKERDETEISFCFQRPQTVSVHFYRRRCYALCTTDCNFRQEHYLSLYIVYGRHTYTHTHAY